MRRGAGPGGSALRLLAHVRDLSRGRGRVVRWRLETYGLYMPSYPHQRPWWAINPAVAVLLVRRLSRYSLWLEEMEGARLRRGTGTWQRRLSPTAGREWQAWLAAHVERDDAGPA